MKKIGLLLLCLLMTIVCAFADGQKEEETAVIKASYSGNPWTDGKDLSGTTVNLFGAFVDEDAVRFGKAVRIFEEETGIDVVYEGSGDFETLITIRTEAGDPPDIAFFPQPGLASDLSKGGYIKDMADWLGKDYLKKQYNQAWLELAEFDGIQAGIWYRANIKSLVWYNKTIFDKEGYQIPQTWKELLVLSNQMVSDGYVPWAIGIESSGATGWPATDWLEDIMLRIHKPEVYDAWVAGDLKFNSPEFKEAVTYMSEIWFNDSYILGGREGIVLTPFGDAIKPVCIDPPAALMHRQASFIPAFMPKKGAEVGVNVDFFYLPPIKEEMGKPVLGAGDLVSALNDRPEVRAVMRFLSQGISTKGWLEMGGFASPHKDTDMSWYPTESDRKIAEILQNATTFRFDASDLMPGAVGAGTFWTGITDYVNNPNADSEAIWNRIDASYPR